MDNNQYILVREFCHYHHVQYSFINSLCDHGLLELTIIEDDEYLEPDQVRELERFTRLHYDLEINVQGLDAINHLLSRVSQLQNEVRTLQNRLKRYEE